LVLGPATLPAPAPPRLSWQIKQANPQLGKQAKVLLTSMDRVYDFAKTPRTDTNTSGVVFRFVPDPTQVEAALQVRQQQQRMHTKCTQTRSC